MAWNELRRQLPVRSTTRMRKSASSIPRASTSTSSDACSAKADSSPRSAAETSGRRRELFLGHRRRCDVDDIARFHAAHLRAHDAAHHFRSRSSRSSAAPACPGGRAATMDVDHMASLNQLLKTIADPVRPDVQGERLRHAHRGLALRGLEQQRIDARAGGRHRCIECRRRPARRGVPEGVEPDGRRPRRAGIFFDHGLTGEARMRASVWHGRARNENGPPCGGPFWTQPAPIIL